LKKYDEKYKSYIEQIETKSDNKSIKQYIYDKVNKIKEKKEKNFQSIVKDLENTSFRGGNIFDTLVYIKNGEKTDIEIEKAIMNIFEKYKISDYQRWITDNLNELSSLSSIVIEDGSAMNELKLNSQDEFIDLKIRKESLKVIEIIEKNSENVVKELINHIKNENFDSEIVSLIIDYFDEVIDDKNYLVSILIELWEDENINDELKYIFIASLDVGTISNNKLTNIMLTASEEGLYYPMYYFSWVEQYDNNYIDRFVKLLEHEEFYEDKENIYDVSQNFAKIAEKNFYAHIKLIELLEKELDEDVSIEYSLFLDFYIWEVKTSILFQDYDKDISLVDFLFEHITHNNKVLFIENNKLCTIEDGKKIYTQRDINSVFFEELEEWLEGDKLND